MPRLTLTFDNGPSTEVTPFVLDELAARDLAAYFFVVGSQLRRDGATELAGAAAAAGHRVGGDGVEVTLDLPDSCVPIRRGVPADSLAGYVASK